MQIKRGKEVTRVNFTEAADTSWCHKQLQVKQSLREAWKYLSGGFLKGSKHEKMNSKVINQKRM